MALLTTIAVTNTSGSATPGVTCLPFGHPFVKGDVPTSSKVQCTWTPSGGSESAALTVQVSGKVTWSDGSLKFARIGVALPSIAGSGTGSLKVYSVAGSQNTTIPGGKTAAQVATDLSTNFAYTVTIANLHKGRERIDITSGGTGYTGAGPTITATGGTPDQGTQAVRLPVDTPVSGGAVYYASVDVPPAFYSVAPTLSAAGGGGSGFAGNYYIPPVDGSGAWTWSGNTQLGLLATTDSRGRTRCEVVESGPLHVTFHVWGPFVDNTGGASHPHLIVRAFYRCWLDASTGAIDRVESFHYAAQGWIEDLAGGSTVAEVQVGDFAVKLNGSTVTGRSWARMRIPHHTMQALVAIDGTANEGCVLTGGSDWTSNKPTLGLVHQNGYWRDSCTMPPWDTDYFAANPIRPATDANPASFAPGARNPNGHVGTGHSAMFNINSGAEQEYIGLWPQWTVRAFHSQHITYLRSDLATAFVAGQMQVMIMNPATGRINKYIPDAQFATTGLGTSRENTFMYLWDPPSYHSSADIVLRYQSDGKYEGGTFDTTDNAGGWYVSGDGWTCAHWPSLVHYQYLRTGAPWLLEMMKVHGQNGVQSRIGQTETWVGANGSGRNLILYDGSVLYGRIIREKGSAQERVEGWAWKALSQTLSLLPDDAIERPYYQHLYDTNDAAVASILSGWASANFKNLGDWSFELTGLMTGLYIKYLQPWMQQYLFISRCCAYLALERPANTLAFLQHHVKMWKELYGGGPSNTCGWTVSQYASFAGPSAIGSDYYPDWGSAPQGATYGVMFDSTGWVLSHPADLTTHTGGTALQWGTGGPQFTAGTKIQFHELSGDAAGDPSYGPPASGTSGGSPVGLVKYQWYYIATVDLANKRFTISPNADLSNPFTAFSASQFSGSGIRFANCPTPNYASPLSSSPVTFDARQADSGADFGLAMSQLTARLAVICGLANLSDAWVQTVEDSPAPASRLEAARAYNNWSGNLVDWRDAPKHRMAPALGAAAGPTLVISPTTMVAGTTGTIGLTVTGITMTPGTPGSPSIGVSSGIKNSQAITAADTGSIDFAAPGSAGTVVITVPGSPNATANLTVTAPGGGGSYRRRRGEMSGGFTSLGGGF